MARVQGYNEDEVDVLVADFERVVRESIRVACAAAAANLKPMQVLASTHAFHLPGKHDQKTHAGRHMRPITVTDSRWDRSQPWQQSDDEHVRATNVWSESYGGQQGVVKTMRNMHRGDADPVEIDESDPWLRSYAKSTNMDTGEQYGMDAVRADVHNAAVHLDTALENPADIDYPLYRGMRVDDAGSRFKVGDTFDSDISSWSDREQHAAMYTLPGLQGRPSGPGSSPVIMRTSGGTRGVRIDDGSLGNVAGNGEHLLRGTFRVTAVELNEDNEYIVDVEQL